MNLKKIVLDKIEELGVKGAADYFKKAESSIRMWQKSQVIPLSAVEKVMAEEDLGGTEPSDAALQPAPDRNPPQATPLTPLGQELDQVWQRLSELNTRLTPIENFVRENWPIGLQQEAPQPPPSMIEPIPSLNVPPVITSVAPVFQEAVVRDNKPPGTRSPNAEMRAPIPGTNAGNSIGGPGDWMRPRPLVYQQPRQ